MIKMGSGYSIILAVIMALLLGMFIPVEIKNIFYTLSVVMKDLLILILPFVIFSMVSYGFMSAGKSSVVMMIVLFCCTFISSFLCFNTAYLAGSVTVNKFLSLKGFEYTEGNMRVLFDIGGIRPFSTRVSIIVAIITGISGVYLKNSNIKNFVNLTYNLSRVYIERIFIPLLPLFIFGFTLKLQHDSIIMQVVKDYPAIIATMVVFDVLYIATMFLIASRFSSHNAIKLAGNIIPAALTGFTTMSSMSAMPLILKGVEQSVRKKSKIPKIIVPTCINIHMIGNAFVMTVGGIAILKSYGMEIPGYFSFFPSLVLFALASFGQTAVPGGGLVALLPIISQEMGFNSDMSAVLTALFLMSDCFFTASNAMANGAFCIMFDDLYTKLQRKFPKLKSN